MFFAVAFAADGILKCHLQFSVCITAILLIVGVLYVFISVGVLIGTELYHVGALSYADGSE
jgi:hypothetical protein